MSEVHEIFDDLAAGWALGALEPDDAARFEAHLREGCAQCERTLEDYRDVLVTVAGDLREVPPPRVRDAVLERAGARSAGAPSLRAVPAGRRRTGRLRAVLVSATGMALAAGLAAIITASAMKARYAPRLEQLAREADGLRAQLAEQVETVSALRQRLTEQEHTLTMVRADADEQRRQLALLTDPATRIVELAGQLASPRAQGRVIWNPRAGGLLVALDLPPAPPGKTYELWAIAEGTPRPAGLFNVDAQGKGTLAVAPIAGVPAVEVFAVTLEPEGGVPQPTGQMYLVSKA
jgi:anti-sigma-K factor RskA